MTPKEQGEISEAVVLAALMKKGKLPLLPFGDNQRYDIVIDEGSRFDRIQVKTGRLRNGVIVFAAASRIGRYQQERRGYKGQADYFAVYCPETEKVYLVPVNDVGETEVSLRIEPTKNGQSKTVRWAKDYEI
jgi:hypothetical protein